MNYFIADFNPVAVSIGFLDVRWYALAYVVGVLLGSWLMQLYAQKSPASITKQNISDFMFWAVIGIIIGGRFGHVFFYYPLYYLQNPAEALQIWKGGMAFHGGIIGLIIASFGYCRYKHISFLAMGDLLACAAPIGLFLGRIANFINGELWGRTSEVAWAVIFPRAGTLPRHPSQLYEAMLEGLLLFVIINSLAVSGGFNKKGLLSGVFLLLYAVFRSVGELFREPEVYQSQLFIGTWGQWLSVPMFIAGSILIYVATRKPR